MKTVAKVVKLIHPRTRIALPRVEMQNRAKRTRTLGMHPLEETRRPVEKAAAPLLFQPGF